MLTTTLLTAIKHLEYTIKLNMNSCEPAKQHHTIDSNPACVQGYVQAIKNIRVVTYHTDKHNSLVGDRVKSSWYCTITSDKTNERVRVSFPMETFD